MATKPSTLPRPWATNAVYLTGPFAGDPGKVDPGVGVAAEGHRPGAANPTAAEHENYQQNLVTASWIPWVNSGSSAGAADAHIIETASTGRFSAVGAALTGDVSGATLAVTAGTNVGGIEILGNGTGRCLNALSGGSAAIIQATNSGTGKAGTFTSNTGTCLDCVGSGALTGSFVNGTLYAMYIQASGNGTGVLAQGAGGGAAVYAIGGNTSAANAINASCDSVDGFGIDAQTRGDATSTGRAAKFQGKGSAPGIEVSSLANHAIIMQPDATAPVYGAIKQTTGSNALPTDSGNGQLSFVASTYNAWMHSSSSDGSWRGMWSTVGGFCYGKSLNNLATNNNSAVYTTLATVTMVGADVPKEAGRVVVLHVAFRAGTSVAGATICDVQVRDTTSAATLITRAGTGLTANSGYNITGATTNFELNVAFEIEYTIPVGGGGVSRTFVLEFKKNSGNAITAHGGMSISGSY